MHSKEILHALQAGKINFKDAEKELIEKIEIVPEQSTMIRSSGLSDDKKAIAIVGMSGRYPEASGLNQYWHNIANAKNSIQEIPKYRWDVNQYYDPRPSQTGKIYCKWLGLLDDIEKFDPLFFNISPSEAEAMDPQHRIFLQEGYKAFEDAGYTRQLLSNKKCGVYLGIMSNEYGMMMYQNHAELTNITGNSYAIAAARIPYFLNLKGPAIPIDTACSSSLVATHLACQALLNQEIDIGLVGGVSLYLTPESYISMCAAGMLSPEGQCKTFDNSANGFVPGEGVGALVLKRLSDAESDNDHIYGVIIGSGINQDGKTNGITAPSVNSQIELAREIYHKYKIHPESISYVEMHGTGTKLGDPIELEALSKVFKERTNRAKYCAIGSVKSNIGHTSAAAGVASIQKVLLCLKNKTLVPTLNFDKPNEHFDFEDSPFYVNTELRPWEGAAGIPRRAGVSSFGFSGTNAHIVIEEYLPRTDSIRRPTVINTKNPAIFVLSAKSEQQLKTYAEDMKNWIESHEDIDLTSMAYTLQIGREAMNHRLAFLADSRGELIKMLAGFIDNNSSVGVLTAQVRKSREGVAIFEADEDANALLQTWLQKRKLNKVAELWVKGLNIDWNKLYGDPKPRRISLPTYPFAKERYWIPERKTKFGGTTYPAAAAIHPLLHQNTSDLSEQRFSSTFTGKEFFLADHVMKGQRIFPGMAYLEMARAAVEHAAGGLADGQTGIQLKSVVWAKPITMGDEPVQMHIGLLPGENGQINYEIYSRSPAGDAEPIVFSQGIAMLSGVSEAPTLNIAAFQAQCSQSTLTSSQCYEAYKALGIDYGPSYQGIEKVYLGSGQMLAKLSISSSASDTLDQFVLHPGLMVSALQAAIGLTNCSSDLQLNMPFALKELEIFGKCPSLIWAVIRYGDDSTAGDKVPKFDIDLCDEQGTIGIRIKGMEFYLTDEDNLGLNTLDNNEVQTQNHQNTVTKNDFETLKSVSIEYLKALLAEITKIPVNKLDYEVSFDELGLDSIMISQLNQKIEQSVGKLDATLFFKYNDIQTLGTFFAEEYPDAISKLANKSVTLTSAQKHQSLEASPVSKSLRSSKFSLRPMASTSSASNFPAYTDIAVIGVAGRYPQARTLEQFWRNLYEGKDCIEEIPPNRWSLDGFFEPDRTKAIAKGLSYSKWGGFLEDVDCFDPLFFNISPRDTMYMDPQERLFLEAAWECLENAGYTRQSLKQDGYGNQIGVFVGATFNNYQLLMMEAAQQANQDMYAVNSQIFSIANRVSFVMNFTGPSLTVDTACASSLYAVHLACESIRSGQSRMAIAGGVNLSLHPSKYITIAQGQFHAADGRCRAFCEGGTGYVPSEAVGAIFLKPLQEAIKDNDIIYGIIKGTAVSHAGKTNGYTVPSPVSQSLAIETALKQSRIDPRSISCIEAHGTGTALGDPIEITGLTDVFRKYTKDREFCSISSVKSNIGHTEAAAGISQLTKVLLQLKHKTLVQNVMHGKGLNPNIDFAQTPFVVQTNTEYWERPLINGQEAPRRAGISAFGAGGANAHVIIEEYIPQNQERPQIAITPENPAIIALSAKNEERLKEQAKRLLRALQEEQLADHSLANIAYTLQVGREAMEERLGLIVESIHELQEKLKSFVEGRESDLYRGQAKRNKESITIFNAEKEMQEIIEKWIQHRNYGRILELWVKGLVFDWNKLYGNVKPQRISLPAYPFVKTRYWPSKMDSKTESIPAAKLVSQTSIHPLIQQNTSTLLEQRFSSTFTGREFFLSDHVVKGQRVLPGMAYVEMARAAVEQAAGVLSDSPTGVQLRNVVWARPIAVGEQFVQVHTGLFPGENGEIAYEIYSEPENPDAEPIVHSQGSALLSPAAPVSPLDLKALKTQCSTSSLTSSQCYEAFKAIGIDYGPGHQGIEMVYIGDHEVLAKLVLPSTVSDTEDQFVLHPSLMDAALQTSIGLMMSPGDLQFSDSRVPVKPSLPFALQTLEIHRKCCPSMWALVRYSDGSKAGDKVQKLDIDLCDDQGNVCVRMKGFSSRVLEGEVGSTESIGRMILEPFWQEQAGALEAAAPDYDQHVVMLCEPSDVSKEGIESRMKGVRCFILESNYEAIEERFRDYTIRVFEEIQNIFKGKPRGKVLIQIVVSTQEEQKLFSGLSGLLKSAQLENPKIIGQLIEVEPGQDVEKIVEILNENSGSTIDQQIRYQAGKRYSIGWREIQITAQEANIPWKDQGVYLITGGAGGVGRIFAGEIARRVKNATLILTGRSPLSENKQAQLRDLETLGARVIYKQIDVTEESAVMDLIQSIRGDFGNLHGIIHSAGVIHDNLILKKNREELQTVLGPKVNGVVNLDRASKDLPLDFFVFFSSGVGVMGNIGQADYSAANAFMDAYAKYRNNLVAAQQRQGQTLSINWPLWKEGGMRVEAAIEKMIWQSTGMSAMQTSTGIWALYQGLASGKNQVRVMEGNLTRIKQKLLSTMASAAPKPEQSFVASGTPTGTDNGSLLNKVQTALAQIVSKLLKVRIEDIDVDTELSEYGFDSITLTEFANKLNQEFNIEVIPTMFFEQPTLHSLAAYLIEEYQNVVASKFAVQIRGETPAQNKPETSEQTSQNEKEEGPAEKRRRSRFARTVALPAAKPDTSSPGPIAIVGMSGLFPMARDLNEFWKNLVEGKDCITEIPRDRWDWQEYYGDPAKEANKTKIKWGGFIDGVDKFDPLFFGVSPREAEFMDPQQRLLMTYIWKAIEDAGIRSKELSQRPTGVFIAAGLSEYASIVNISLNNPSAITNAIPSIIPNRISYALNLQGASEYCEAACASTFVALHRALQSIYHHECEQAIVGAVNLLLSPRGFIGFEAMDYLSPTGQCKSFQAEANGYVRSEGVGAIIIKPLHKAIENRDHIYAVIKGTGVSHGGKGMSLTAPNANGMKAAMVQAYRVSEFDPRTVSYIEGHGIGSPLGDGIEINALKAGYQELAASYSQNSQGASPCYISSLKPCIGHGEIVSGMAALFKVILAIQHRIIPGIPGYKTPSENISLKGSPYQFIAENQEWQTMTDENGQSLPRRASINSYGFGGVNTHVVLEEYISPHQETLQAAAEGQPQVVIFSAKTTDRLRAVVEQILEFTEIHEELSLADFAYTLQVGREAMESRLAMVVSNHGELIQGLKEYLKSIEEGKEMGTSIPIFAGKPGEEQSGLKKLLSGKVEETVVKVLLEEKNLETIALYWTQGGSIPWAALHNEREVQRMSLPTYSFEKRRCWVNSQADSGLVAEQHRASDNSSDIAGTVPAAMDEYVINIISHFLGISPAEVNLNKSMHEYGLDSITLLQLLKRLQTQVDPTIDLAKLKDSRTIQDIINVVRLQNGNGKMTQQSMFTAATTYAQFPELIRLNQSSHGRPIFWFHPIQAGVEVYSAIAQKSRRPFYGIQARGWMTDRAPLRGIQRIASYYAHIVQSVQPEGPYDLGGYSLGGVLAYEVTRQLQELGQVVDTIVMLDSMDGIGLKQSNTSQKSRIMQAANMALASTSGQEEGNLLQTLIHRDEVNSNMEDEQFLQQLIMLAQTRGLNKTETQLYTQIQQMAKIQQAYELEHYSVLPLPDPQAVTCYYFRNKSELFWGELEPYLTMATDENLLDHMNYWGEWEQQLPNFYLIDAESSNHFMLLSEPKANETILGLCEKLYSIKGISAKVRKSLKNTLAVR